MAIEVLTVQQAVEAYLPYRDEPGFFESVRSLAARILAEKTLREAAIYRKIEPEDRPVVLHRWTIGLERDMDAIKLREQQMEEARQEGRREAAAILYRRAASFDGLTGHCGHVIQAELREAAREIQAIPPSAETPPLGRLIADERCSDS